MEAVKRLNCFKNIVTGIDNKTLKEALFTMNYVGIGLCILDDLFFDNKSDGMIYTTSQRKVENVLDVVSYRLKSTHHDVYSNIRAINQLLEIVDDTIDEYVDRQKVKIK